MRAQTARDALLKRIEEYAALDPNAEELLALAQAWGALHPEQSIHAVGDTQYLEFGQGAYSQGSWDRAHKTVVGFTRRQA